MLRGGSWALRSLGMVLIGLMLAGCDSRETPSGADPALPSGAGAAVAGSSLFEAATQRLGVTFLHDSGAKGDYVMWEQMASGVALLDYDQDGRLDLYFVQCGGSGSSSPNRLYHQETDGRYRDVSPGSGVDVSGWGMGAYAGDVNNDGFPDLVVTEYGATRLFLNQAGSRFEEVTGPSGLDNPRWATAASFLDFDRDGWLDLAVVNYLDYDPARKCRDHGGAREYCGPQDFPGTASRLFRNLGRTADGSVRFEDVTVSSGVGRLIGPGLGLLCADLTGDRWPDLLITDDGKPNRLFVRQPDGSFADEAAQRGLAYNALGATAGNMGIAVGDANHDGLLDIFVTHLTHEQHAFWLQGPPGLFRDRIAELGLVNPRWRGTGFGAVLADFDLDGEHDLALVNGRVLRGEDPGECLPGLHPLWHPYAQRNQLFLGASSGRFLDVSESNPDFCGKAGVGRALAWGDLDNDGDVDLVATCTGGPATILINTAPRRGHWLTLRLVDPAAGGRDAIGAVVEVTVGGRVLVGWAQPSSSFLSSHDPRVHFGLGTMDRVVSVRVLWPDGTAEWFDGGPVDTQRVVRKGSGRTE